jgi:hypothetical protein
VDVRGLQVQALVQQMGEPVNSLLVLWVGALLLSSGLVHVSQCRQAKPLKAQARRTEFVSSTGASG